MVPPTPGGGVVLQPPGPRHTEPRGPRFFHQPRFHGLHQHRGGPYQFRFRHNNPQQDGQSQTYDGKRIRKAIYRKTVDYNTAVANYVKVLILFILCIFVQFVLHGAFV